MERSTKRRCTRVRKTRTTVEEGASACEVFRTLKVPVTAIAAEVI